MPDSGRRALASFEPHHGKGTDRQAVRWKANPKRAAGTWRVTCRHPRRYGATAAQLQYQSVTCGRRRQPPVTALWVAQSTWRVRIEGRAKECADCMTSYGIVMSAGRPSSAVERSVTTVNRTPIIKVVDMMASIIQHDGLYHPTCAGSNQWQAHEAERRPIVHTRNRIVLMIASVRD